MSQQKTILARHFHVQLQLLGSQCPIAHLYPCQLFTYILKSPGVVSFTSFATLFKILLEHFPFVLLYLCLASLQTVIFQFSFKPFIFLNSKIHLDVLHSFISY